MRRPILAIYVLSAFIAAALVFGIHPILYVPVPFDQPKWTVNEMTIRQPGWESSRVRTMKITPEGRIVGYNY